MADDVQDLLRSLPLAGTIPKPPGYVAILRAGAEEAEADLEAVDAWVTEHGGRVGQTRPIRSQGNRAGQRRANVVPGELYYLLPASALEGQKPPS